MSEHQNEGTAAMIVAGMALTVGGVAQHVRQCGPQTMTGVTGLFEWEALFLEDENELLLYTTLLDEAHADDWDDLLEHLTEEELALSVWTIEPRFEDGSIDASVRLDLDLRTIVGRFEEALDILEGAVRAYLGHADAFEDEKTPMEGPAMATLGFMWKFR